MIPIIKVSAGSGVLCPVRLDVGLTDFLVVPRDHLLFEPYLCLTPTTPVGTRRLSYQSLLQDVVLVVERAVCRAVEADLHLPVLFLSRTVFNLAEAFANL